MGFTGGGVKYRCEIGSAPAPSPPWQPACRSPPQPPVPGSKQAKAALRPLLSSPPDLSQPLPGLLPTPEPPLLPRARRPRAAGRGRSNGPVRLSEARARPPRSRRAALSSRTPPDRGEVPPIVPGRRPHRPQPRTLRPPRAPAVALLSLPAAAADPRTPSRPRALPAECPQTAPRDGPPTPAQPNARSRSYLRATEARRSPGGAHPSSRRPGRASMPRGGGRGPGLPCQEPAARPRRVAALRSVQFSSAPLRSAPPPPPAAGWGPPRGAGPGRAGIARAGGADPRGWGRGKRRSFVRCPLQRCSATPRARGFAAKNVRSNHPCPRINRAYLGKREQTVAVQRFPRASTRTATNRCDFKIQRRSNFTRGGGVLAVRDRHLSRGALGVGANTMLDGAASSHGELFEGWMLLCHKTALTNAGPNAYTLYFFQGLGLHLEPKFGFCRCR